MRKSKRNNFTGRRGASVLIAMLVFLLAAFAGSAVLAMSSADLGRHTDAREEQEAYLTIASAIKYVRAGLDGLTITVTAETGGASASVSAPTDALEEMNKQLAECCSAFAEGKGRERKLSFAMSAEGKTVEVSCTVKEDLSLTYVFSHRGDPRYRSQMTVPQAKEEEGTFSWDARSAQIERKTEAMG